MDRLEELREKRHELLEELDGLKSDRANALMEIHFQNKRISETDEQIKALQSEVNMINERVIGILLGGEEDEGGSSEQDTDQSE